MYTRHRLCQFRKSKHLRHQRLRSRIFHRDKEMLRSIDSETVVDRD